MPRPQTKELIDAGKRMADHINIHLACNDPFDLRSKWMVFALADGGSDGTIYDSCADAKRHSDEWRSLYFCFINSLGGVTAFDCSVFIQFSRDAREAGLGQKDPNEVPFLSVTGGDNYRRRLDQLRWN